MKKNLMKTVSGSDQEECTPVCIKGCVEVTNNISGCMDTACVLVKVETPCPTIENLQFPNAFSPNDDGLNDVFCLQEWNSCNDNFAITIFDRWGRKIFESPNPYFCWDGTYQETIIDSQVFVYFITAKHFDSDTNQVKKITKKGNISLIR